MASRILLCCLALIPNLSGATDDKTRCIQDRNELLQAIDDYLDDAKRHNVEQKYGNPIGSWCVSKITDFSRAFDSYRNPTAAKFNEDLNGWDVSNAVHMDAMFADASRFNGDISNWDVSKVEYTDRMFSGAHDFNRDLSNWDTSRLKNADYMFACIVKHNDHNSSCVFNSDISNWNVGKVTSMNGIFQSSKSFNQDLDKWNVQNVVDMERAFEDATAFNGNIATWNTSSIKGMAHMFRGAVRFNGDLSKWDVSSATTMRGMFASSSFNGDISKWDVSHVTTMESMFFDAKEFNQDLSSWKISNVYDMSSMFEGAVNFNQNLCPWREKMGRQALPNHFHPCTISSIFSKSGCPNQMDPDFNLANLIQIESLCRICPTESDATEKSSSIEMILSSSPNQGKRQEPTATSTLLSSLTSKDKENMPSSSPTSTKRNPVFWMVLCGLLVVSFAFTMKKVDYVRGHDAQNGSGTGHTVFHYERLVEMADV